MLYASGNLDGLHGVRRRPIDGALAGRRGRHLLEDVLPLGPKSKAGGGSDFVTGCGITSVGLRVSPVSAQGRLRLGVRHALMGPVHDIGNKKVDGLL